MDRTLQERAGRTVGAYVGEAWRRVVANWRLARRDDRSGAPPFDRAGAIAFLGVGLVLVVAAALVLDARVVASLPALPAGVRDLADRVTHLGLSDWVLIPTAVLVIVVAFGDWSRVSRRNAAAWAEIAAFAASVFLMVAAAGLFTDVLKPIFGRMRPPYAEGSVFDFAPFTFGGYRNYSFPSGHSTVMGALAVFAATAPRGFRFVGVVFCVVVACTRFVIGVHYPSDTLAGLLIGASIAWLIAYRMARGGFGFVFAPDGAIVWRLGVVKAMWRRGGLVSGLVPPLLVALSPRRMVTGAAAAAGQAPPPRRATRHGPLGRRQSVRSARSPSPQAGEGGTER